MYPQVSFSIPKGMDQQQVAETFTAFLLGARAQHNQDHRYGPFQLAEQWQLDASNDYLLREADGRCVLSCRYQYQATIVHAMAALFSLRMHQTDLTFGPGDSMLITPSGQIDRVSQTEILALTKHPAD